MLVFPRKGEYNRGNKSAVRVLIAPTAVDKLRLSTMSNQYTPKQDVKLRFWSKVAITANPDKCWEWQARTINGYGLFSYTHSITKLAHRVAWFFAFGEIPDGLCVCHQCDNPSCVNPSHLFLGTYQDNADDKVAKGRQSHYAHNMQGENNSHHKLTAQNVDEIRRRFAQGGITQKELAKEFSVSPTQIYRIVHNYGWITASPGG